MGLDLMQVPGKDPIQYFITLSSDSLIFMVVDTFTTVQSETEHLQ